MKDWKFGLLATMTTLLLILVVVLNHNYMHRFDDIYNRLNAYNSLEDWEANTDVDNEVHIAEIVIVDIELCKEMSAEVAREFNGFFVEDGVLVMDLIGHNPPVNYCIFCGQKLNSKS